MERFESIPGGETPHPLSVEQERLQEILKQNHMVLLKTGLAQKMVEVQQRLFDAGKSYWPPGELGDSKFWVTTAGNASYLDRKQMRLGNFIQRTRHFEITKANSADRRDQVWCKVFSVSEDGGTRLQSLSIEDGFDVRDAAITYVLIQRLVEANLSGQITRLNPDLHSVSVQPKVLDIEENLELFPVDESLLELDLFSEGFI